MTDELQIVVDRDGVIEYRDEEGQRLLRESQYTPVRGDYKVSQAFEAGSEAIYGLGQYQSGVMNWRGVPRRLQQQNQEVAIPFVVSTKGYGIYWNNYSITDFNPAEHEILFEGESVQNIASLSGEGLSQSINQSVALFVYLYYLWTTGLY